MGALFRPTRDQLERGITVLFISVFAWILWQSSYHLTWGGLHAIVIAGILLFVSNLVIILAVRRHWDRKQQFTDDA
jgi:ABC-type bacteriocin/lantibiotic exporter with double-glycine peptidase domain